MEKTTFANAVFFGIIDTMKEVDPKMHTAEHILNQAMVKLFGSGRCFSAHIEKKKSKCDYYFDRTLSEMELQALEAEINDVICAGLPVSEIFIPENEARSIYDKYGIKNLPQSSSGTYRAICIGEYDKILCTGTHVKSTSELGQFRIISVSHENGVLRIRFKLKQESR